MPGAEQGTLVPGDPSQGRVHTVVAAGLEAGDDGLVAVHRRHDRHAKGAMIPHRALVKLAQSVTNSWGLPEWPVHLAASPITHAAVLPVTATLARGGTVVLQQRFDARRPDQATGALARSSDGLAVVPASMGSA